MNRLAAPLRWQLDRVSSDWQPLLQRWGRSAAGQATLAAVDAHVESGATVYPAHLFRAFEVTPLAATKVLILGQDPYHGPGQAEGLAFSVPVGQRLPPSLRNVFKELQRDLALAPPHSGSLLPWAERGVLLLNTTLTVEDGQAASHAKLGWHALTDAVCQALWADQSPRVFMLWGAHAQARLPAAARAGSHQHHRVLQCNHPSPLSATRPPAPFIGCGHFSSANRFLTASGRGALDWQLP